MTVSRGQATFEGDIVLIDNEVWLLRKPKFEGAAQVAPVTGCASLIDTRFRQNSVQITLTPPPPAPCHATGTARRGSQNTRTAYHSNRANPVCKQEYMWSY